MSVPATDLLITACAQRHGVQLETVDSDFDRLTAVAPIEMYTPDRTAEFAREAEVDPDTRAAVRGLLKRTDD